MTGLNCICDSAVVVFSHRDGIWICDAAGCIVFRIWGGGGEVSLREYLLFMTRSVPMDSAVNSPIDPGPNRSLYKSSALKEYESRMLQ